MAETTPAAEVEIDIEDTVKAWAKRRDIWLYISVPDEHTARMDAILNANPRGFRSVPVTATLGGDHWDTALFRYQDGTWALPLKGDIRNRHKLGEGDAVKVHVSTRP